MIGRSGHLCLLFSSLAVLTLSACTTVTAEDEEWDGNLETREQGTFEISDAPEIVLDRLQEIDASMQAMPERLTERLAFDEERAIQVSDDGIEITRDTMNYIFSEWLPQVTGSDQAEARAAERAAKADEELRTQVASTRNTNLAPVTAQSNGAAFDLNQATPMAASNSLQASAQSGSRLAATPAPVAAAPVQQQQQPQPRPAVTKSLAGGIEGVGRFFDQNGYTLDAIRQGRPVPPVFARRLPRDMNNNVPMNKDVFLRLMVPIALKVNEEIAAERATIERSGYRGPIPGAPEAVRRLALKYDIQSNTTNLLQRVDVLPVSLILAQAGLESGWGTSRYVQQGNALFGQRVWDASTPGMTPSDRGADQSHRVRTFSSLEDSTRSYAMNLNTNRAYLELRRTRAALRQTGRIPTAQDLIPRLQNYSEDASYYASALNTVVNDGRLTDFDRSRLSNGQPMNLYL